MKYLVPVCFRGLDNFLVEADSTQLAKAAAELAFKDGDEPVICGNEWQEVETVGEPEVCL